MVTAYCENTIAEGTHGLEDKIASLHAQLKDLYEQFRMLEKKKTPPLLYCAGTA